MQVTKKEGSECDRKSLLLFRWAGTTPANSNHIASTYEQ